MSSILDRLFSLTNKTALITGATGGIGEALAVGFAQAGAAVGINSRSLEKVAVSYQAIETLGMKEQAIERDQERTRPETFRGGGKTFFHKGTNGRWQGVLSEEELAMYTAAKVRVLSPACAHWLEAGRAALG